MKEEIKKLHEEIKQLKQANIDLRIYTEALADFFESEIKELRETLFPVK